MPSDFRLRQGRNRSKIRAYRGAHSKIRSSNPVSRGNTVAIRMYQGPSSSGHLPFSFWTSVNQCLRTVWARRHLGLLLLLLLTLVILWCLVNNDSLSPSMKLPWFSEAVKLEPQRKLFYYPTTCIIRENQEVVSCSSGPFLNKSDCLKSKCCVLSSSKTQLKCYAPVKDKPTQMFRVFGTVLLSMIILGFLPVYFCTLCRRRNRMKKVVQLLKKQSMNQKKEPNGKKASEKRALLSR